MAGLEKEEILLSLIPLIMEKNTSINLISISQQVVVIVGDDPIHGNNKYQYVFLLDPTLDVITQLPCIFNRFFDRVEHQPTVVNEHDVGGDFDISANKHVFVSDIHLELSSHCMKGQDEQLIFNLRMIQIFKDDILYEMKLNGKLLDDKQMPLLSTNLKFYMNQQQTDIKYIDNDIIAPQKLKASTLALLLNDYLMQEKLPQFQYLERKEYIYLDILGGMVLPSMRSLPPVADMLTTITTEAKNTEEK
jgi:hypothetical protein